MALVEIPRRKPDPTWPKVKWPYRVYPSTLPVYREDGQRVPDYIPSLLPKPPNTVEMWRPCYKGLPDIRGLTLNIPWKNYKWRIRDHEKVKATGYKFLPNDYKSKYLLLRRFDQEGNQHIYGQYHSLVVSVPGYDKYADAVKEQERQDFLQWGPKDMCRLVHPYEIIYDSRLKHPTSDTCYSAVRLDKKYSQRKRMQRVCGDFREEVVKMAHVVELYSIRQHAIIIIEQTALAGLMMNRIMWGMNLPQISIAMCFLTYMTASRYCRYPSLYLVPCIITIVCWFTYTWEYRKDPCDNYSFWTTWVNTPYDHQEALQHVDCVPHLLRQERMTFMQLEDNGWRYSTLTWCKWLSIYFSLDAFTHRLSCTDAAFDSEWTCLGNDAYSFHKQCTHGVFSSLGSWLGNELSLTETVLFWGSSVLICSFIVPPIFKWFRKQFDWKTRSQYMINRIAFRAMRGERRYMKLVQPLYWQYRWTYPNDRMGTRDECFLSEAYRHSTGSFQFYY